MDEKTRKRHRGAKAQRKGKTAEKIARLLLEISGVRMVEKIATPFICYDRKPSGHVKVRYTEQVSGDWRGIMVGSGRRVLCEVKARDGNLRWGDFKDHQITALSDNHMYGGVSLIVWIHPYDNLLIRWPMPGDFEKKGDSLTLEAARNWEWDEKS